MELAAVLCLFHYAVVSVAVSYLLVILVREVREKLLGEDKKQSYTAACTDLL